MQKHILFLLFFSSTLSLFSQKMSIEGTYFDTTLYQPIYAAKAYLIRISDSVIVKHQNTDAKGDFRFEVPIDQYRLIISHPVYNDKEFVFVGTKENFTFALGEVVPNEKGNIIEGIAIYAYKDPLYYKGDTLIYIADSFATKDNAVVEDLLKRLPGITVESDGSIKSQGKDISKVYVDGDEFFGSDPTVATKNLAAKSIDRVQVYEKDPEDGSSSDEKLQILDLRLKENAKKGWFAKANAATDFKQFYESQLLYNRFQNKQKIFAFGIGSNTLNSSISRSDAGAAGVSSNAINGNSSNGGYPQTFRIGAFFNDQITKKFKLSADYIFADSRVKKQTETNTTFLLPDTTYSSINTSNQSTQNQSHNLNLNLKFNLDSSQTLEITPRFTLTQSKTKNESLTTFKNDSVENIRKATNLNTNETNSFSTNTRIAYTKKMAKPKRVLNLSDNVVYNQSKGNQNLNYLDYFFFTDLTDNEIRQLKENNTANFSNTFNASYKEPLSDKWALTFDYEFLANKNDKKQYSYNFDGVNYSDLDSLTSNQFSTNKFQNRIGATANYSYKKHSFNLGTRYRNVIVNNDNLFTGNQINQNVSNLFPVVNYTYKISQSSNFRFILNTNSSLPSVEYLSPVRDNTNPNAIMIGNENLKPNYSVNGNLNYMIFKPISGFNFSVGALARYTFNDFARSITYDEIGRSISRYENINAISSLGGNTQMIIPIYKKIIQLNPKFTYAFSQQNSIVNTQNNQTNTHNLTPELNLMIYADWVELNAGIRITEQIGINSTNENLNINNTIINQNTDLKFFLPAKIDLILSGKYYNYANMTQGFNSKFFIMNAAIDKYIGKYDQWKLSIEGYDLLNQNLVVNRSFSANTITDVKTNIISRYFLFRVTYTFNSTFRPAKTVLKDENFK